MTILTGAFVRLVQACAITILCPIETTAYAQSESANILAEKIVAAYGGDKIRSLQSIRLQDDGLYSEYKYGYTPNLYEYDRRTGDLELDLENQRGSYDYRVAGDRFGYHNRTVSAEDGIAHIVYAMKLYEPAAYDSFYQAFGAPIRTSDTLIAHLIARNPSGLKKIGVSSYFGRNHVTASFDFPGSDPVELYIDAHTGFISRMDRKLSEDNKLTYLWSDHKWHDGLTFGSLYQLHFNDHLESVVTRRRLTANTVTDQAFLIDAGVNREPERLEMEIKSDLALSETVHLTGDNGSYSLFVDAGDHIIAAGTTEGFKARFEQYSLARGAKKPLKYVIATQHAAPHLAGIKDAVAVGAIIVAPRSHKSAIQEVAGVAMPDNKVLLLDDKLNFGPVEVYAATTTYTDKLALVYVPVLKAIYQTDSYGNSYTNAPGFAGSGGVALKQEIDSLGLDAETILFVYSPWPDSYSNFEEAVSLFARRPCFSTRALCSSW